MVDRVAVVSGVAGGIGRSIADGFAAAGYAVTGIDRTETPEEERARIAELLADRLHEGRLELPTVILKGVKS